MSEDAIDALIRQKEQELLHLRRMKEADSKNKIIMKGIPPNADLPNAKNKFDFKPEVMEVERSTIKKLEYTYTPHVDDCIILDQKEFEDCHSNDKKVMKLNERKSCTTDNTNTNEMVKIQPPANGYKPDVIDITSKMTKSKPKAEGIGTSVTNSEVKVLHVKNTKKNESNSKRGMKKIKNVNLMRNCSLLSEVSNLSTTEVVGKSNMIHKPDLKPEVVDLSFSNESEGEEDKFPQMPEYIFSSLDKIDLCPCINKRVNELKSKRANLKKSFEISKVLPDGGVKIKLKLEEIERDLKTLLSNSRVSCSCTESPPVSLSDMFGIPKDILVEETPSKTRKKTSRTGNKIRERKSLHHRERGLPSLSHKHLDPVPKNREGEMLLGFNVL